MPGSDERKSFQVLVGCSVRRAEKASRASLKRDRPTESSTGDISASDYIDVEGFGPGFYQAAPTKAKADAATKGDEAAKVAKAAQAKAAKVAKAAQAKAAKAAKAAKFAQAAPASGVAVDEEVADPQTQGLEPASFAAPKPDADMFAPGCNPQPSVTWSLDYLRQRGFLDGLVCRDAQQQHLIGDAGQGPAKFPKLGPSPDPGPSDMPGFHI